MSGGLLERGDVVRLRRGASAYRGTAEVLGFSDDGVMVRRPDGSRWLWPREYVLTHDDASPSADTAESREDRHGR